MILDKRVLQALRNAGPQEWDRFVSMFAQHTTDVTDAVTDADASGIMEAKGRALQCKFLLRVFKEIDLP